MAPYRRDLEGVTRRIAADAEVGVLHLELGQQLEGGLSGEPRAARTEHGHRSPEAGDLAGTGHSLHKWRR